MAQNGYTPISLYYSTNAGNTPSAGNLVNGEVALNIADSVMSIWFKNASGTAKKVFANPAGLVYPTVDGTANQVVKTDGAGNLSFTSITSVGSATNLAGGVAGSVPYQSGVGATTFLGIGTASQVLQVNAGATAPEWVSSTGTGNVVRATSPTLTTPTLGVASATSVNKLTITAPATGSTLTIADGKTLTANNSLTLAGVDGKTLTVNNSLAFSGTDSTTMTLPPASASLGYLNVPVNSQTSNYTAVLSDSGKALILTSGSGITFTIPANGSVAYEVGTVLTFINMSSSSLTIAITSDTLYWAGSGTTGSRTLTPYGVATAIKMTSTTWIISGSNLS